MTDKYKIEHLDDVLVYDTLKNVMKVLFDKYNPKEHTGFPHKTVTALERIKGFYGEGTLENITLRRLREEHSLTYHICEGVIKYALDQEEELKKEDKNIELVKIK